MDSGPEKPGGSGSQEPEIVLSQSGALAPLLVLFGLSVLAVVVLVLRAKPVPETVGSAATRAYGPADFKERLAQFDPLEGLEIGAPQKDFPVPKPPFTEGNFPCSECHDPATANPERRTLELAHDDIRLNHDEEHRWCLDCHDRDNRDSLRLASGALVPFEESYRLCGQCHGTQFRDWRSGIHGKRTGYWNGPKRYLLCVHCHNPHSPRYMDFTPFPPPVRPEYLRLEDQLPEDLAGAATSKPAAREETHG